MMSTAYYSWLKESQATALASVGEQVALAGFGVDIVSVHQNGSYFSVGLFNFGLTRPSVAAVYCGPSRADWKLWDPVTGAQLGAIPRGRLAILTAACSAGLVIVFDQGVTMRI